MKSLLRIPKENLLIYMLSTALIFSLLYFCSCATGSGSVSYCEQLAEISKIATLLLCEALSNPDTVSANYPTHTLHYFSRVVVGDTISFLSRTSRSGAVIISWKSRHHPDGAVLIEPSPILAESDSLR